MAFQFNTPTVTTEQVASHELSGESYILKGIYLFYAVLSEPPMNANLQN